MGIDRADLTMGYVGLAHRGSVGERRAFPMLGVKPTSRVVGATAAFNPKWT
jgi:hypothetical protein